VKAFLKSQVTFLLFGFVFWLPIGVLIFVVLLLLTNLEDFGRRVLSLFFPDMILRSGYGIVLGILIIYFSGMILKLTRIREALSKVPVVGLFFGAGEIITIERLLHMSPCLFLLSPTCVSYGWILSEERIKVGEKKGDFTLLNVYYPSVPAIVTGSVFPLRKSAVIRLGNSSKEIIDLLLYAIRSPADLKYLPWEDETEEDFERRAISFGLSV
jgi:uncharacterized membrane protein